MPRGLGDDPLSRQRKNSNGRPVASNTPSPNSVAASYSTPSVQPRIRADPIAEAASSSQPSPSYNDVFFQRRFEDDLEHTPTMNNDTSSPNVAEPVVQPTEATQIGRPSVATGPADAANSPQPKGEKDAAPAETPPTLGETLIGPKQEAKAGQPETGERGFFKRIFGRMKQQKSH